MFFSRNTQQKELENLENNDSKAENTLYPGQNTCCIHFEIKSNLGWMEWKNREAALYIFLERAFAATKCVLKIDDNLTTMGLEIEIPYDQEEKFMKAIKSKTLAREIDKIHGIEPALCSWIDARISNIRKTGGSTNPNEVGTSSIESIRKRIEMLEKCSETRTREVLGIKEMALSIQEELNKKFDVFSHRIDMKAYEKCGKKFDMAELKIMKVLKDELAFLASPTVFKHPPNGIEHVDSGARAFLAALNSTVKMGSPTKSQSPQTIKNQLVNPTKDLNKYALETNQETNISETQVFKVMDTFESLSHPEDKEIEKYLPSLDDKRVNSLPPPIQIGSSGVHSAQEEFSF